MFSYIRYLLLIAVALPTIVSCGSGSSNGSNSSNINNSSSSSSSGTSLPDRAPVFKNSPEIPLDEDALVVEALSIEDEDLQGLKVEITGGADRDLFNIDSVTKQLSFIQSPDFENPLDADLDNIYELEISATDSNSKTTKQSLRVSITDVSNIQAVIFHPVPGSNFGGFPVDTELRGKIIDREDGILSSEDIAGLSINGDPVTFNPEDLSFTKNMGFSLGENNVAIEIQGSDASKLQQNLSYNNNEFLKLADKFVVDEQNNRIIFIDRYNDYIYSLDLNTNQYSIILSLAEIIEFFDRSPVYAFASTIRSIELLDDGRAMFVSSKGIHFVELDTGIAEEFVFYRNLTGAAFFPPGENAALSDIYIIAADRSNRSIGFFDRRGNFQDILKFRRYTPEELAEINEPVEELRPAIRTKIVTPGGNKVYVNLDRYKRSSNEDLYQDSFLAEVDLTTGEYSEIFSKNTDTFDGMPIELNGRMRALAYNEATGAFVTRAVVDEKSYIVEKKLGQPLSVLVSNDDALEFYSASLPDYLDIDQRNGSIFGYDTGVDVFSKIDIDKEMSVISKEKGKRVDSYLSGNTTFYRPDIYSHIAFGDGYNKIDIVTGEVEQYVDLETLSDTGSDYSIVAASGLPINKAEDIILTESRLESDIVTGRRLTLYNVDSKKRETLFEAENDMSRRVTQLQNLGIDTAQSFLVASVSYSRVDEVFGRVTEREYFKLDLATRNTSFFGLDNLGDMILHVDSLRGFELKRFDDQPGQNSNLVEITEHNLETGDVSVTGYISDPDRYIRDERYTGVYDPIGNILYYSADSTVIAINYENREMRIVTDSSRAKIPKNSILSDLVIDYEGNQLLANANGVYYGIDLETGSAYAIIH